MTNGQMERPLDLERLDLEWPLDWPRHACRTMCMTKREPRCFYSLVGRRMQARWEALGHITGTSSVYYMVLVLSDARHDVRPCVCLCVLAGRCLDARLSNELRDMFEKAESREEAHQIVSRGLTRH